MARGKRSASSPPRATLIGDIVGSRRVADRSAAHRALNSALRDVASSAIDPPAFTVGDEFQGSYPTVGAAIDAALKLRLAVAPGIDVRFGIGWGAVTMLDAKRTHSRRPGLVGGARGHRVDGVRAAATRPGDGAHVVPGSGDRSDVDAINAALLCRDHLIGSLDDRSLRILKGLLSEPHEEGHRGGRAHQRVGGVAAAAATAWT